MRKQKFLRKNKGFTLIELLIVIGIIAVLAAIIFVAVDPARRLAEARNAQRWSSVNSILNAVLKYTVDNAGILPNTPVAIDNDAATVQLIGENSGGTACNAVICTGQIVAPANCFVTGSDSDLVDIYLASIPQDPSTGSADDTRYYINKSPAGRITVGACDPERGITISVSR